MREVPLSDNLQVFSFAEALLSRQFDMVILLTGVGARLLNDVFATRYDRDTLAGALKQVAVVCRGPKPASVMREWGVPIAVTVPEPNTWREILKALEGRTEDRIAIQEYGRPAPELVAGLEARGAQITLVPVYQWAMPEDLQPLRDACRNLGAGQVDVTLFTAGIQAQHLLQVAAQEGLEADVLTALRRTVVASIGPTTSETLAELGLTADIEPSHPRMGFLVNEASQRAHEILQSKR